MASFVLVHGAWHGAWCWRDVVLRLEAAEYVPERIRQLVYLTAFLLALA